MNAWSATELAGLGEADGGIKFKELGYCIDRLCLYNGKVLIALF
jgi:hypothetical protein